MNHKTQGALVLEHKNGIKKTIFPGTLFGGNICSNSYKNDLGYGEVVFNTSMTGYQEILTDPSYFGQIICMTTPHIGNTGVNDEDIEATSPRCAGFLIHELQETPSNWRSKATLLDYLKLHKVPALYDIDTRALTKTIRSIGATRGLIMPLNQVDQAEEIFQSLPSFEGRDLIGSVTTKHNYAWPEKKSNRHKYNIVAIDYGMKKNLLRTFDQKGCYVTIVPANTSSEKVLALNPDGIFLSNGPGDPSAAPYAIQTIKELLGKKPIFGICMGHQILSIALGAKTYKLKFGHRGGNQPVKNEFTGKVEISSQNHGYAITEQSLPIDVVVTHRNLNDQTIEGIESEKWNAFSVQYHPEASPGPHDSLKLFDQFINNIKQVHGSL